MSDILTRTENWWRQSGLRWALLPILLVALWLRAPYVDAGLPFLYSQDEAHHFQRTVHMVKEGDFNPRYFNKPSLHFYLRMPIVAAAFVAAVKAGDLRTIDELVTRGNSPRGGWAYTVSHERVLRWNRAFGVVLGLLVVWLAWVLARSMTGSDGLALGAAWLTAVSPALAQDAAKVGVDTPMVLFCLLAIYLALRLGEQFGYGRLVAAGLVAGLAFSTKYNALPIVALPLLVCVLSGRRGAVPILLALAMPVAGFLIGTPYALVELPRFLNDMAFETWHYGTAGHGAATSDPGLPQAWFYLRWFASDRAVGVVAVMLAGAGTVSLAARRHRHVLTFLLFPALFFLLMIDQKVNFTRNVLVLLPVLAVLAVRGTQALTALRRMRLAPGVLASTIVALGSIQPLTEAVNARSRVANAPRDTRTLASQWLSKVSADRSETVVASELNWPTTGEAARGVTSVETAKLDPTALYLVGYDRLVVDSSFDAKGFPAGLLRAEQRFVGQEAPQRVVRSPALRIFELQRPSPVQLAAWLESPEGTVAPDVRVGTGAPERAGGAERCSADGGPGASGEGAEGGCWIRSRTARLVLDRGRVKAVAGGRTTLALQLELRSPWPEQRCSLAAGDWRSPELCAGQPVAQWFTGHVEVPAAALRTAGALTLDVREVHTLRLGRDDSQRVRVGLAVRSIALR